MVQREEEETHESSRCVNTGWSAEKEKMKSCFFHGASVLSLNSEE